MRKRQGEITENEMKSKETGGYMKTDAYAVLDGLYALSTHVHIVVAFLCRANLHNICMPGAAPVLIKGTPSDAMQSRY
jgi:hypothetical protein